MDIKKLSIKQLQVGYNKLEDKYHCIFCSYTTNAGEVYPYKEHFYTAIKRMQLHIEEDHQGVFISLLDLPKKQNTLTDSQKKLLMLMYQQLSDKEVAKQLQLSESTIRHQRFILREKALQAKVFLSLYEQLDMKKEIDILEIHQHATQVDERYMATKEDEEKVCKDFLLSKEPLVLKSIPKKEKYKIIILRLLVQNIMFDKEYSESEINDILRVSYADYVSLRRYLIEYGFLERNDDGTRYKKLR
jgi:hypothetical protein